MLITLTWRREPILLRKKMNVDPFAVLSGVAATVCVVDDDPSMLKALERLLLSAGFSARFFREPLGFLAYAKSNSVGVALIDIWLPGMNGLELTKKLHAISPHTRVIVVTADDEDSVRSVAMQNGATAFFAKPFEDDIFLDAVRQAMAFNEPETPQFGARLTPAVVTSPATNLAVLEGAADEGETRFQASAPSVIVPRSAN